MRTTTRITLLTALMMLFIQCSKNDNNTAPAETVTGSPANTNAVVGNCPDSLRTVRIAYVDYDSLLANYNFAQEIHKELIRKEMSIGNTIDNERKNLRDEAMEFERKMQNNLFLSEETAQAEYKKIVNKDKALLEREQQLVAQLDEERNNKFTELTKCINSYINEYNKCKGYDFILTRIGGNMLYANGSLDITHEIVDGLNAKYKYGFKE